MIPWVVHSKLSFIVTAGEVAMTQFLPSHSWVRGLRHLERHFDLERPPGLESVVHGYERELNLLQK